MFGIQVLQLNYPLFTMSMRRKTTKYANRWPTIDSWKQNIAMATRVRVQSRPLPCCLWTGAKIISGSTNALPDFRIVRQNPTFSATSAWLAARRWLPSFIFLSLTSGVSDSGITNKTKIQLRAAKATEVKNTGVVLPVLLKIRAAISGPKAKPI